MGGEALGVGYTVARMGLSLVPGGGAVQVFIEDTRARHLARYGPTIEDIVASTGFERLCQRLAEDEELEGLFVQALECAAVSGHRAKRRLLGRLVAVAVLDDAKVDEGLLFVLALRDLEGPHVRALERLRRAEDDALGRGIAEDEERANALREAVKEAAGKEPAPVLAALNRAGLTTTSAAFGGALVQGGLSDFGRALLGYLKAVDVVPGETTDGRLDRLADSEG